MGRGGRVNKISRDRLISRKVILCFQKAGTVGPCSANRERSEKNQTRPELKKIYFVFLLTNFRLVFNAFVRRSSARFDRCNFETRRCWYRLGPWGMQRSPLGKNVVPRVTLNVVRGCNDEPSDNKTPFYSYGRIKLGTRTKRNRMKS